MTAELRNLPHIASMAFNEPLMLEPAYARVFFCALAGQLGISRLTDAVSGDSLTAGEAPATLALSGNDDGPRQARSYQVMNGIAVLPVSGTLVSRTRALQPYSGMTGYNGIIARLQQAASDPMVDGILLDMDTPGGMVAGAFDCADIIARVRDIKPVWALANDMNCSAGQLLASAASRRLVTQTARTGSIGVMMAHSNYGAALEKQGVEITLIYSGSHKVDGNPYSHLPDDVRETLQSRMDATRQMFAQKVSAYTGLSVQAVLDTEAAVYSGQEAIDVGLADELVNSTDAITVMRDALDARKSRLSGGRMTKETQSTTVSATASQTDVTDVVPATEGENASAAQPDVNAQITAAVAAENSRIMGILNCEEAHGREEQARVLAEPPGMTVETARRILAAAPQSAQARSDTALDRLMQGAPAPLAAGNPASFITKGRLCGFFLRDFFMSMYTTAQLLAANEKKFKFDPLFLRLFFRESYPFTTEKVYLSQIPGLVNMALYVSPIVSGEVIRSRGGSTSEFTPGYVKPKHEVNPQMTLRRLPDEDPQNLADPAYRRRRIIMQNMRDEELAIAQVEEMQAVSAVLKGKYTMTGEAFDPVEVDMGRSAANNITQSGGTEWSKRDKSTYDPTDDIEAYALNASGVVNIIVFDPKGWALFRSFKAVKEKLDTRRGSNSELETAVKDLGEAVSYKGMYGDTAIVVYSGQYVENDVKKNFLPDNTMVLGNTQARGLRTYGCIQDADAQREGINASARYPKNWVTTGDPAREFTMIQSAPLMLLADPDAFVSVQLA
ncbi:clp protease family protein [Escherichia coli 6-537-08_S3_C1]|nr:clp protease family protein [Escherichia coli 6-537-08_S3_C1]